MGMVLLDMAMSLDGIVADRNDNSLYPIDELHKTKALDELIETTGAVVMGRRAYEMAEGHFTEYEYQVPIFVVTHNVPEEAARGLPFTFVTDGIASAIEQARATAGEMNVGVIGGAGVAQECIRARVLDEIQIRLMPILLGEGIRLFENLGTARIELEQIRVIGSPTRTDIRFRVVK